MNLSEQQQKILDILLSEKSAATADELVSDLGITKTAVKAHLDYLANLGLLIFKDEAGVVGRPKRKYSLSEGAADAFPKQYSWLASQVLEQLAETMAPQELVLFMRKLAGRIYNEQKDQFKDQTFNKRLKNLETLMGVLGYKAKIKENNAKNFAVIEAFNCVYHDVAKVRTELCEFDRQLISYATDSKTTLQSCIAKGGKSCRFCIKSI